MQQDAAFVNRDGEISGLVIGQIGFPVEIVDADHLLLLNPTTLEVLNTFTRI